MFTVCMPLCRASKEGHILIVSSLSGFVPLPGQTAYSATKFALRVRALDTRTRVGVLQILHLGRHLAEPAIMSGLV